MTPETSEKKAIKQYLSAKGIFHFSVLQGLGCHPGVSDIICLYRGLPIAIEVKAVGRGGRVGRQSEKQAIFQLCWERAGGVYILGGVDDVMKRLSLIGNPELPL